MASSDINVGVITTPGPKSVARFRDEFGNPIVSSIAALESQLAMGGTPWTAGEVTISAKTLVTHNGETRPMSLAEILQITGTVQPYISAQTLGLAGDGATDDGPALQRGAEQYSADGGAIFMLKALPGQSFFFKGTPRGASNVSMIFFSPHTVTATSRLTLQGAPALDPAATGLTLTANAASGATSMSPSTSPVGGGALSSRLPVGSTVLVTGLRDSCGTQLQEQWLRITAVDDGLGTITFAGQPLNYTFESAYTAGDYEAETSSQNVTLISRMVTARASGNVSAGSNLWPIDPADIGKLTDGDWVLIYDEKRCSDIAGSNNSLINIEMARIVPSVSGDSAASLRLSRYIERDYTTAKFARLIKINPIVNASISGATVEFTQAPDNTVSHAFEGRFAVDCEFGNCTVPNTDSFGSKSNAVRWLYSDSCKTTACVHRGARYVGDGEGNSFVLAWSTDCQINDCVSDGARHGIQMLGATNCTYSRNIIQNARHTPIDHHGANSRGCVGYDNVLTASTTYEAAPTKAPPAVVFGNPTLLAGDHRCGLVGGRIKGYKDPTGSSHEGAIQFFPPSTGCFLRSVEFVDIGKWITFSDVASHGTLVSSGHRIDDCSVDGCVDYLIDGNSRANGAGVDTFVDVQITECEFRNIGKMIRATYAGELQISNCRFDEITVNGTYPYVAVLDTCANFYFSQNTIIGSQSGLHLTGCANFRVLRNEFADQTAGTVLFDNGSNTGVWADNLTPGYTPSANRSGGSVITEGPRAAGKVTMADDTAFSFIPQRTHGTIQFWSYNASTVYGMCNFIAVGTTDTDLITGSTTANVARATGILAGTTGTDTKITISAHTNGQLFIENRTGSSLDIDFSIS